MKHRLKAILDLPAISFVADVVRLYFSKHVSRSAAHLAYFLTLTFFPILICISAFMGRINLRLADLLSELEHLLPTGVYSIFQDYVGYLDSNFSSPAYSSQSSSPLQPSVESTPLTANSTATPNPVVPGITYTALCLLCCFWLPSICPWLLYSPETVFSTCSANYWA